MRYFEDFPEGQVIDLGTKTVTEAEILAFARQFDPQPFHTDPAAAAASPFGGLIASGWHTAAMIMRLYVDAMLSDADSQGSPGIEALRWLRPVRPGDTLRAVVRVASATPSATRPDRGTLVLDWEVTNQSGETVMTMSGRGLFGRRPD
ncbi:MaoC family dehydratase [Acidiferrimicrobium sp. IK]|uniref:MaoC family dehydratase n=1 Tax=Acidiferrimicrobium sp. IK TaxID=2871700 RepID=UPI0021CB3E05|nr:MaoC family dehydratase [Acidiferrimicrobium sp. IK]MCU4186534.1 MaoC family dehydratase [Acidiferrimicrobium sp. IK]